MTDTTTPVSYPEYRITAENQTSGSGVSWVANRIIEWSLQGFTIDIPAKSAAQGHYIVGKFQAFLAPKVKYAFEFTSKIAQLTPTESGLRAQLIFTRHDEATWTGLLGRIEQDQANIQSKLTGARGVDFPTDVSEVLQSAFRKYIPNQQTLIADSSVSSRESFGALLVHLGAKSDQIQYARDLKSAREILKAWKPTLLFVDFEFDGRNGVNLVRDFKKMDTNPRRLAVILTSRGSQTTVARAVEEDVDAIIMKPLSGESVRALILRSAAAKVAPNDYQVALVRGSEALAAQKLTEAEAAFRSALSLHAAPVSARCGLGCVYLAKKDLDSAESAFKEALAGNKIHLRSLEGLADTLIAKERHAEAFEVLNRMIQYFPPSPPRLSQVLRLALQCGNYEEIEKIALAHRSVSGEDHATDRYIAAAMVVCGRHYLKTQARSRAIALFDQAFVISRNNIKTAREIVVALLDRKLMAEAEAIFKKIPSALRGTPEYEGIQYALMEPNNPDLILEEHGNNLVRSMKDPLIYGVLIRTLSRMGNATKAKQLSEEAKTCWPEQATLFKVG